MSNTLANKAVLVNLEIPTASMTRTHRGVTAEVLTDKHAQKHVGRFVKNLLPAARAAAVQSRLNELRSWHYTRTTIWDDCGSRLLAATAYFDYLEEFGKRRGAIAQLVREQLVEPWDDVLREAAHEQGELYDAGSMPGPTEIESRLVPRLTILPIPQSGHLMVELPEQMLAEAREQLERDVDARFKGAMGDVWGRVTDALERIVDRLGNPNAIFRDSLIENARELVELLPGFNLTGDPRLNDVTRVLREKIACHDPSRLRNSTTLRAAVAQEASELLAAARGTVAPVVAAPIDRGTFAGLL